MIEVVVKNDAWDDQDSDEAVIGLWIYENGARVKAGDVIGEMMVLKSQMDIVAPASGILEIIAQPDDLVRKGDLLCKIKPVEKVRVRVKAQSTG